VEQGFDTLQLQKAASPGEESSSPVSSGHSKIPSSRNAAPDVHSTENSGDEFDQEENFFSSPSPSSHPAPLNTFPKEFNKNYLESLDRRYLIILLLTLILEPLLILYLLRTYPPGMDEREIAKLQSKYAELFMSEFKSEDAPSEALSERAKANEFLLHASKIVPEMLGEGSAAGLNIKLPGAKPGAGNPEVRTMPGERRQALRRMTTRSRQRGLEALSREVERIGLLGIITSGSGLVSYEPIADILEYADSTAWNIEEALSEVKTLRVPRVGVDYFGQSVGGSASQSKAVSGSGEVFIADRQVRGKRADAAGVAPEEVVTELAETQQKMVERNRTFEQVAAVPSLTGLRSRPTNGHASRDPAKIRELVSAHNPAVQDCYRRQLRATPTLRGKVTIRFTINPAGHVSHAQVYNSSLTADSMPVEPTGMLDCILSKVRNWRDFGQVDESLGDLTFRQTYVFGY
jgi:hypothetical protein